MKKITSHYFFYDENNNIIIENKTPETEQKAVKLSVYHSDGRLKLSIAPVTVIHRDGYSMESFIAFSNFLYILTDMSRFAPKKAQAWANKIMSLSQEIAKIFLDYENDYAKTAINTLIHK